MDDCLDVRISREQVGDIEERWPSLSRDELRLVDEVRRLRESVNALLNERYERLREDGLRLGGVD